MKQLTHQVDFCIVGGGMSGICAAVAAARHGAKVALVQDRPMLGGNASSEIRMHICGAHGENNRETGLLEEILLESLYRNDPPSYSVWDSILYEKVYFEKNITLFLNTTCVEAKMEQDTIQSIRAWQMTSETWHTIEASFFADCSGDSILAPLTGAKYRVGREAREEFNENIEPLVADKKTMGMSLLIQPRETNKKQTYIPPAWAYKFQSDDDIPFREHDKNTNFWWMELGGEADSIHDTDAIRDELLKTAFGVWDHMKNYGDHGVDNFVLDWVGFLPGKRESRRYIGDHTLTQNDVEAEGRFDDLVAYGGWTMDDHNPAGMKYMDAHPTIYHPAPSPYGIPYRCMYSQNIKNLFVAGRNISVTHAALSSTRVMATCAMIGQAVGTAASIAVEKGLTPRGVYEKEIRTLQNQLMEDDSYLPWHSRKPSALMERASLWSTCSNPEVLANGIDRPIGTNDNGWIGKQGDYIEYRFDKMESVSMVRFVFDSDLNRNFQNMPSQFLLNDDRFHMPGSMIKAFRVEALMENGEWVVIYQEDNNYQRLVRIPVQVTAKALRFVPLKTWGNDVFHVFSWDIR